MDVTHVLLGRPWLYDHAVKHCGCDNTYKFTHDNKNIHLQPAQPVTKACPVTKTPPKNLAIH